VKLGSHQVYFPTKVKTLGAAKNGTAPHSAPLWILNVAKFKQSCPLRRKKKQRDCQSAANEMAVLKNRQSRSPCS
jgi:hypothetical protein